MWLTFLLYLFLPLNRRDGCPMPDGMKSKRSLITTLFVPPSLLNSKRVRRNGRPRIEVTTQTRSHLTWRGESLDFCLDTAEIERRNQASEPWGEASGIRIKQRLDARDLFPRFVFACCMIDAHCWSARQVSPLVVARHRHGFIWNSDSGCCWCLLSSEVAVCTCDGLPTRRNV